MKKFIFLTLMAFLIFTVTAYSQQSHKKATVNHTAKKPVTKKPVTKAPSAPTPCYGYASLEAADSANTALVKYYNEFETRANCRNCENKPVAEEYETYHKVRDEIQRMARAGYGSPEYRSSIEAERKARAKQFANVKPLTQAQRQAIYRDIERKMKIGLIYNKYY